jgi:hypothetical protein
VSEDTGASSSVFAKQRFIVCCSVECDQLGNARSNSCVYEAPAVDPSYSFIPSISDTRREGVGGLEVGVVCGGGRGGGRILSHCA